MGDNPQQKQYRQLGSELKKLRLQNQQSIAEVSGSVEIDIEDLARFENGETRPGEEILLLLISHFDLTEEKATKLWGLAGYGTEDSRVQDLIDEIQQAGAFVLPQDARIMYTDVTHASASKHGVVINFMQSAGPMGKPMIVSRMGMSKEHAKSMIELLQKIVDQEEPSPRLLEAPKQQKSSQKRTDKNKQRSDRNQSGKDGS